MATIKLTSNLTATILALEVISFLPFHFSSIDEIKDFFLVYFNKDEIQKEFILSNEQNDTTPFEKYQKNHCV